MSILLIWKFFAAFAIICSKLIDIVKAHPGTNSELEFIILHNNDMHARFEQTNAKSVKCTFEEDEKNLCYGGFARVAHEVKKYRELAAESKGAPVLFLNAGDTYTGTPWFTIFKNKITSEFLNLLQPDAMSLGNHEFDEGLEDLTAFLDSVKFPVLASNLNLTNAPQLIHKQSLRKSAVFILNGTKIGIIGYVTPETKFLTYPNDVEFYSEIKSINQEANVLKNMGIKILIALGHSGFATDKNIAKNCPDIDIVIGGHTNTFLYNGQPPDIEQPEGPYPTVVEQSSGKKVPVVQAYAYTKYLGYLQVKFNNKGDLISWTGQPILLNYKVTQDQSILQILEKYRPNITALENVIIGYTRVNLEGRSKFCRTIECNLGNMIADAMVHAGMMNNQTNKEGWTDAAVAFIQGGGIRSSISKNVDGFITRSDIISVLPYNNQLYIVEVNGKTIRNALERSASMIYSDSNGGFLQMSGVRVVYDLSKPIGKKVKEVFIRCAECNIPRYEILEENKKYKIILSAFILAGGDGYKWSNSTNQFKNAIPIQQTEVESVINYIQYKSPIYPGIEGRIKIINDFYVPLKSGSNKIFEFSITIVIISLFQILLKVFTFNF